MATQARGGYADCRFGQLHYLAWQPADATGAPLLLLHPRSRSCRPLLPHLPARQAAYIVDLPGLGNSSPLADGATMQDVAGAVVDMMQALSLPAAHVYGIHTGNKVAAALAAHWPRRVRGLLLCGKSHSIVPDREQRNAAMKEQADRPDSLVVRFEGKYLDDVDAPLAMARLYSANFAFDLTAAVRGCQAPLRVIEITSPAEDQRHGRQGAALAALAEQADCVDLPQVDSTGLDLYTGAAAMAAAITQFISER
jgi:pimeloyl-ACP methyl ester carboxylesterase